METANPTTQYAKAFGELIPLKENGKPYLDQVVEHFNLQELLLHTLNSESSNAIISLPSGTPQIVVDINLRNQTHTVLLGEQFREPDWEYGILSVIKSVLAMCGNTHTPAGVTLH